jgi:cob(I)alamin adenosyltransferase
MSFDQPADKSEPSASAGEGDRGAGGAGRTDAAERVRRIDTLLSHIWMVRTFLKHSDEAEEDEELREIVRDLYDYMLALGPSLDAGDDAAYLRLARKKFHRLRRATELYVEIQPEVSGHTNFKMAARSLQAAVDAIEPLLER